ncbi:MAG: UDP-N-acetylmuramate:L-alanyl-gamma-D-glutamyl-meso-diaminopimelate ligase [Gammaproteobacteria bacterium]|nr:UDP-N-acetylmuramate:L-alanyl-gamma-D-glutamyl-meso-diaminopimelate ligase [Gammaproteobacteria bacterium]
MKIHIMGICGTFMGGLALLAKQAGFEVTGSDQNIYPPMSTQLAQQGITLLEGFSPLHVDESIDCVIVGNVIRRGNPLIESIMMSRIPWVSGPAWLYETILKKYHVLAVSGTHGKTTTTSLLSWILECAGLAPSFLVGGVPENFGISARLTSSPYFVIEADEYDSAFFDKRSKFLHYRPRTLILNNLEFDHADIFDDLATIQKQFHHLVRTVPNNGRIIYCADDNHLIDVLEMGCWTPRVTFGKRHGQWRAKLLAPDGSHFIVMREGKEIGEVKWDLIGEHNVQNALAALIAAQHVGVATEKALAALTTFKNVRRRMEIKNQIDDITIYDDFAHHPTAIATTLSGLRARIGEKARLIAVVELGSYTMRTGHHKETLSASFKEADFVICQYPSVDWDVEAAFADCAKPFTLSQQLDQTIDHITSIAKPGDHIIVMSNSGFGNIHQKLAASLEEKNTIVS